MDPETVAVVGIVAGVGGTLAAGLLGPVIAGRTHRRNRLLDRRLDAYADLMDRRLVPGEHTNVVGDPVSGLA